MAEKTKEEIEKEKKLQEAELKTRTEVQNQAGYISQIIAAINLKCCDNPNEVKPLLEQGKFWEAVKKVKPKPLEEHKIIYDSSQETLEPVYYWVLDKMNEMSGDVEKLVDNFTSSPGSGHFSELRQKATIMQEQAMKYMQTSGVLIKSVINIIYDLKEFEILLKQYEKSRAKDKAEQQAAILALKQRWMDNVDMKRGQGSINALSSGNLNFVTLRDAFMAVNDTSLKGEDGKEIDLNERVKRILQPRIQEFLMWKELSEKELIKRYEIEKTYLKNQLDSLKLYARWSKPYLRAAMQLDQKDSTNPALVNAFNTILFELTLFGKKAIKFEESIYSKELPQSFRKKKLKRKYYACALVDIYFRGIPQKAGQHYVFGGRAEVTFRAFDLNDEEFNLFHKKLDESDLNDSLKLVSGMTDDTLKQLQEDISYFLKKEDEREKEIKEGKKSEDVNPFLALFGLAEKKKDEKKEKKDDKIKKDSYIESIIRAMAKRDARTTCFNLFDIYKKGHGMFSHPGIDFETELGKPKFKDIFES